MRFIATVSRVATRFESLRQSLWVLFFSVVTGCRDADTQKRRGAVEAGRLGSRRVLQVQRHHSQPGMHFCFDM